MIDPSQLPAAVNSILVTRLDALGDIVLGTTLLSGLHAKWPEATIILVVRPQLAGVASILPDWVEVRPLSLDPRESVIGRETEVAAKLREFSAALKPDIAVVSEYNRIWASEILAGACGAGSVLAFDSAGGINAHHRSICTTLGTGSQENWRTIQVPGELRESAKYIAFLDAIGLDGKAFLPRVAVRDDDRAAAAALWEQTEVNPANCAIFFPGSGDGPSRSLTPATWARWIARVSANRPALLLGSTLDEPMLEAIASAGLPAGVHRVLVDPQKAGVTAAFIDRAGAYIGMDTGPTHIAAVLGKPTLSIFGGGHCAERFLPVGPRAAAVRMPIGCYGCDWLCPFDRRLCIKDIPEQALFDIGNAFLRGQDENASPFAPRIFEIKPPAELPAIALGPIMRQHRGFLRLNHELAEHHAYLAAIYNRQQERIEAAETTLGSLTRENHDRKESLAHISATLTEMSGQNQSRDDAIVHLSNVIAEMTRQNGSRDQAINHVSDVIAEMSRQNESRDQAIDHINKTLAEMTLQNNARDTAISTLAKRR